MSFRRGCGHMRSFEKDTTLYIIQASFDIQMVNHPTCIIDKTNMARPERLYTMDKPGEIYI